MRISFDREKMVIERDTTSLDRFVQDFAALLQAHGVRYVIVSGYVSILFGRSRSSEDVDIIIEHLDRGRFLTLWNALHPRFECIITENADTAWGEYLLKGTAVRFSENGKAIPNVELSFPADPLDRWTLEHRKEVFLNRIPLHISPPELQIPFKLFLGSEKDIEDARHLYRTLKTSLDAELLRQFNRKLKVEGLFNKYLR